MLRAALLILALSKFWLLAEKGDRSRLHYMQTTAIFKRENRRCFGNVSSDLFENAGASNGLVGFIDD